MRPWLIILRGCIRLPALEKVDVFAEASRELNEELGLAGKDIGELVCMAIIEDVSIAQPELVFGAKTIRTRTDPKEP